MLHFIKSKDPKVPPRLQLDPSWRPQRDPVTGALPASGKLWDFTEKIAKSRREGKNRRDGATVSTRVLRLTDMLGLQMFVEAELPDKAGKAKVPTRLSSEEKDTLEKNVRDARRRRKLEGRAHL